MILQRLATSIRKQDWFTVLIETLIVIFGVYLGIQLGNWNAARAERAQEAGILASIQEDLASDELQLIEGIDTATLNTQAANYALSRAGRELAEGLDFVVTSTDFEKALVPPRWQDFDPALSNRLWSILGCPVPPDPEQHRL